MLTKLILRNFQNHKALTIDIDPLVTTVVGGSDVGKSAVIRALRWLCFNRPAGDAFIRDGSRGTIVELEANGKTIVRSKGPGVNQYELDEQLFTAFGNDVPEDIASVLRIAQLNFQNQHDGPFWFCETPGEISRQMNSVVDLSVMDSAMTYIIAAVHKAGTASKIYSEQVATAKERLEGFAGVDDLDLALSSLECQATRLSELSQGRSLLATAADKARSAAERVDTATSSVSASQIVARRGARLRKLGSKRDALRNLVRQARAQRRLKAVDLSGWPAIVTLQQTTEGNKHKSTQLKKLIAQAQTEKQRWQRMEAGTKSAQDDLDLRSEGRCPLCKQPIAQ